MLAISAFLLLFFLLWIVFYALLPLLEKLLGRFAHWTTHFRYRDYLPVAVIVLIGIVATSFAGDAFLDLAERLQRESSRMHRIDREVHDWARAAEMQSATRFFTILTLIGTPVGIGIIVLAISIVLALRRRWRWVAYLIFTTGVGGLLNLQLKAYFARARPDLAEALRHASGYSFPSGHAMGSTVCFAALSYLAMRAITNWRERAAAVAFAFSMIVAIASSRIYLGVHWISDIGAGIAAGTIWFVTTTVAYETFRRIRMIRSLRSKRGAAVVVALVLVLVAAAGQAQSLDTTISTSPQQPNDMTRTQLVLFNPCGCPGYPFQPVRNGFTIDIPYSPACLSACLATETRFDLGELEPGTYTVRHFLEGNSGSATVLGTFLVADATAAPALDARAIAIMALALALTAVMALRRTSL